MEYVVSVVSLDRPGLIADVTEVLAELGGNLMASSMTLLEGHFVWTLVVAVEATSAVLRERLIGVCPQGVTITELDAAPAGGRVPVDEVIVSLHGMDRVGIVAAVTRAVADAGGNIIGLSTHLADGVYLGTAQVEFPAPADVAGLDARLREVGRDLGVVVRAHRVDADVL